MQRHRTATLTRFCIARFVEKVVEREIFVPVEMSAQSSRSAEIQPQSIADDSSSSHSPLTDSGFTKEPIYDFLKAPPTVEVGKRSRKNSGTARQALAPRTDNSSVPAPRSEDGTTPSLALKQEFGHSEMPVIHPQTPISARANKRSLNSQPSTPMNPSAPPLALPSSTKEWSQSVFAVPALPSASRTKEGELSISRQTSHASMRCRDNADLGGPTGSSSKYYSAARARPDYGSIRQSRDSVRSRADVVVPASPAFHSTNQLRMTSVNSERSSEYGLPPPPTESRPEGFMGASASTDPAVVQDLTKTMIGQFLWKDTRKAFGSGLSGNAHERFFWINPYTKTLYWSATDPGGISAAESSAKSGESDLTIWHSDNADPPFRSLYIRHEVSAQHCIETRYV